MCDHNGSCDLKCECTWSLKRELTAANTNVGSSYPYVLRDDLVCDFVQKTCVYMLCVCMFVLVNECTCMRNERDVRNAAEKEANTLNPESLLL